MVMRTEHEMRRVMEFLGHRFERTMLAHHTRISNITLAPNGISYQYRRSHIRATHLVTCMQTHTKVGHSQVYKAVTRWYTLKWDPL